MSTRSLTLVILISIAVISSILILFSRDDSITQSLNEPTLSDGFMENVMAIKMNIMGKPEMTLYSPKLTHFEKNNATRIASPHFVILPKQGSPWHIIAKHGISSGGIDQVHLWNDVKLDQASSQYNKKTHISTSAMTVHPQKKTAITRRAVTLIQPGSEIKSKGLKLDLNTNTIELLSRMRGTYDSTKE